MCTFCAEIKFPTEYKHRGPAAVPIEGLRQEHPAEAPLKRQTTFFLYFSNYYTLFWPPSPSST
jgi:hypothetical protein